MTKARDIASAIPAPSTVSSAELGFLDGVTSAIQTQVDAKTAKATLTTTGDIYYASAANTPARLAIGSTSNVLTVAGGVPTWAAPAGGGGDLVKISTDSFSGVSSITKDSVFSATYDNYLILFECTASTGSALNFYLRTGGSNITSGYSRQTVGANNTTISAARSENTGEGTVCNNNNTSRNYIVMNLASPFLTQRKSLISQAQGGSGSTVMWEDYKNISDSTSSCAGIYFFPNTGTITGKVSIYGYKV